MADTKTTALTELTTFSGDELFYVVEDDDGTPVSRKVTVENLAAGLAPRIPGSIIARTIYSTSDKNDVTGTLADFDATNLAVTFTVPPSGNVVVRLNGAVGSTASSAIWGLRESTTQVGSLQFMAQSTAGIIRVQALVTVTGLTPGDSKTYKWAGKNSGAGTTSIYTGGNGGVDGEASMEVYAVA